MNKETINQSQKAVEASAKSTIENATKVFDLVLNRSTKLMEKNVAAAKASVERHTAHANNLKNIRGVEDLVKVQENISKNEAEALEEFSREIYDLSSKTATELAKVSDDSRIATNDLVNDSIDKVVKSIPNGDSQPYGSLFKDALRNQLEAFNTFNSFVEKTVVAQQANFNDLADSLTETAKAAPAASKGKRK